MEEVDTVKLPMGVSKRPGLEYKKNLKKFYYSQNILNNIWH